MESQTVPNDPAAQYEQAQALHQAGKLPEAVALYQAMLAHDAHDHLALAGLAKAAAALGDDAGAVQLFMQSLAVVPEQPETLTNLGGALIRLNRPDEALPHLERAVTMKPELVPAHNNLGTALLALHRAAAALESFDQALALRPELAVIHANRGIALHELGRHSEALAALDTAIALQPDYADACANRGNVLRELGRLDEALASYDQALALNPHAVETYNNRGNLLDDLGRKEEAIESFDRAIALKPEDAAAFSNRGIALKDLNRLDEALRSLDQAIALKPEDAETWTNRGVIFSLLRRPDAALADHDHAIALNPQLADAHINRGNVLRDLGRLEEAVKSYGLAIALRPDDAEAWGNRGLALSECRRFDAARADYDHAISLNPAYPRPNWNKALLDLVLGNFLAGWAGYEWRWKDFQKHLVRNFPQPLWLGDRDIAGKTILIHAEQGHGDFIMCCRYLPIVRALGAKVVVEVFPPLLPLAATIHGDFTFVASGQPLPHFDLHCPVMSLPLAFKTTLDTIPAEIPYLFADPARVAPWRQRLGPKQRMRVGLSWSGNPGHKNDHNRSISLPLLAPLFALRVEFHVLQKGFPAGDAEELAKFGNVVIHEREIADFADTAALVEEMDLVISVDTSAAHVAGALNKPFWIMLPFNPDFRWLLDRPDSPWYPTATLFRQQAIGDWPPVIAEVAARLAVLADDVNSRLDQP